MKTIYDVRTAAHPDDVKGYDTAKLRKHFLVESLFEADFVRMTYTMYDRMIVGGAMPVKEKLSLDAVDILRADYFLERRELGIFNVGGTGQVIVDDKTFDMDYKEALYLGAGKRKVYFVSKDPAKPAKFYFNSASASTSYPDKLLTRADSVKIEAGSLEESNARTINRLIVNQNLPTCQLQMGMTELKAGSTWNTMPPHTHDRRMEIYYYFEVPADGAVCHFMGEPTETRHLWMHNEQAVISPEWSIHSACATSNYTFIWGMGGENLDYGDMDVLKSTDLR